MRSLQTKPQSPPAVRPLAAHVQAATSVVQAAHRPSPPAAPPVRPAAPAPGRSPVPPLVQPKLAPHVQAALRGHLPAAAQARPMPRAESNTPRPQAPPPPPSRPAAAPPVQAPAIQKKVGFEFETGDIQTETSSWIPGYWGWGPHAKNSLLYTGDGFELRTDEYEGKSQLELILREIDETNLTEVNRLLDHVIPQAIHTIDAIASACKQRKPGWVQAREIAALRGWFTWITVVPGRTVRFKWRGANKVGGQLQATAGMSLATLAETLGGERLGQHDAAYKKVKGESRSNLNRLMEAYGEAPVMKEALGVVWKDRAFRGISEPSLRELAAVVTLIASIPVNAHDPGVELPYPKAAAGSLLARTDLATIVRQLPREVRAVLDRSLMKEIVITTIQRSLSGKIREDSPVYPSSTNWKKGSGVPDLSALTIGQWVDVMIPLGLGTGTDLLTKASFPGNAQKREWLESMGGFGAQMDPGKKPIFEFRNLAQYSDLEDLPENVRFILEFLSPGIRDQLMQRVGR